MPAASIRYTWTRAIYLGKLTLATLEVVFPIGNLRHYAWRIGQFLKSANLTDLRSNKKA